MSDAAAAEGGKKKKGKLPIIIGLVVVVAAGGYFGLKGGSKEEKKGPEKPVLGSVVDLGEYTVNLKSGGSYLRAKISIHTDAEAHLGGGGDGHGGGDAGANAPLQDVIVTVLSDLSMQDIVTSEGKALLRRRLAYELNHRLHMIHPAEEGEEHKEEPAEGEEGEGEHAEEGHGDDHGGHDEKGWLKTPKYPEFDSDEGPVLKVYLTDFAMQ